MCWKICCLEKFVWRGNYLGCRRKFDWFALVAGIIVLRSEANMHLSHLKVLDACAIARFARAVLGV